ncbi:S41 family peptidase [Enterococcus sp. CWB-B31]|uniref:S41 family peptidase n=1 Tax=Enterococcus sp. CWB-B31 TaxID=2885159 RepID=UPI001E5E7A25|nr:S41 family peptidase [Enterococcus sp. CWB-B31]MCB5955937.1 S41 family peptidase [Enterococcus sp. CWB-B31]
MRKNHRQVPYYQYVVSIICTAIIAVGGCYIYFSSLFSSYISQQTSDAGDLKEVHGLYNNILENYVGSVDESELVEGALKGMMESLDDPYSSYLGDEESSELSDEVSGSFEGIGASMGLVDKVPTVTQAPIEGSPAEKNGLKVNDAILQIDGEPTEGLTLSESVSKIRGEKGTEVQLTILREGETFDVIIERDTIPIETVSSEIDAKNSKIGNIRVSSFGGNTFKELKTAIKDLRKEGAESFVLDFRQNPGGLLNQVEMMSSMFLEDGKVIVQFEDKDGNITEHTASSELDGGFKVKEPVVVLVDGGSASAAEIFAAALKESGNVDVIGTTTYGKGTVQTVKGITDHSSLKLSILKWLTPEGNWIHEEGLEPTVEADYPDYAYLSPISRSEVLEEGSQSDSVMNVNKMLKALDYDVNESDEFNSSTKTAIETLQSEKGLSVTGQVNQETADKIEELLKIKIQINDTAYNKAVEKLGK